MVHKFPSSVDNHIELVKRGSVSHLTTCEIGRQVSSVSGNQNQCEKPECSTQHPSRGRPGSVVSALLQNGTCREPQTVEQVEFVAIPFTSSGCCRPVATGTEVIQAKDEKRDAYYLAIRREKRYERNTLELLLKCKFRYWRSINDKAFTKLVTQALTTAMVESQTSLSKGCKNTNRLTSSFFGFCINKLILKSMKGLLKSTSSSLDAEIVIAPMAT